MIRPLRIQHRHTFAVLGVVLPMVFGFGVVARKPVPVMNNPWTEIRGKPSDFNAVVWERWGLFPHAPVRVRLLRGDGAVAVVCAAPPDFTKPDLLVYWSQAGAAAAGALPADAVLLGAFAAAALPLPAGSAGHDGVLILFNLADQEVVAVSKPFRLGTTTR